MLKTLFYNLLLLIMISGPLVAGQADSLLTVIEKSEEDSLKVNTLISLASVYYRSNPENAINYATQAVRLAQSISYLSGLAYAYKSVGMG
jgi:hypothetical protein